MSAGGWIAVALLGGAGAVARFALDALIGENSGLPFPLGTLAVNLSGAFALGLAAGTGLDGEALAIVAGGGLGSYTTFSTWMFESQRLGEAGRTGLLWLNLALPLAAGIAAAALGRSLGGAL